LTGWLVIHGYGASFTYMTEFRHTKRNACRKCFGSFHMGPIKYNCESRRHPVLSSGIAVLQQSMVVVFQTLPRHKHIWLR
jgi:hypothetical protein